MWAIGQNSHDRPGRLPALRPAGRVSDRVEAPRSAFAAVLFADIVGFTRLCRTLEPAGTFALLSGFHQRMAEAVAEHGAVIGDPIGDGIMAVWCGPAPAAARAALRCGFAMLEAIDDWNQARRDGLPLRIGVGLHAGAVMIGRVGAAGHDKLGAFGDTVNVAHRLERMTGPGTATSSSRRSCSGRWPTMLRRSAGWPIFPSSTAPRSPAGRRAWRSAPALWPEPAFGENRIKLCGPARPRHSATNPPAQSAQFCDKRPAWCVHQRKG